MNFKPTSAANLQSLAKFLTSPPSYPLSHFPATIHALSLVTGLSTDLFLNNLLLNAYSNSGHLFVARKVFDTMPHRSLISWSTIISAYTQHCFNNDAFYLFSNFLSSSSEIPNKFILASVLRSCAQSQAVLDRAVQVQGLVLKTGLESDVYVGTALINCYTKVGRMDDAMTLFAELPIRNSVTWTAIISGFSQVGKSELSLRSFDLMMREGVLPDRFVVSSVISACSDLEFLEGGRQVHGYACRTGADIDVSVSNALIDLYCKCSRVWFARRLFESIDIKNLVSWTTMIAGFMQNSFDKEAMDSFYEMSSLGWKPDGYACTSVLCSCSSLEALKQGMQVHGYTVKANLDSDEYVKNGLIDMYAKCDSLPYAKVVFDLVAEDNVVSYNTMIEGYTSNEELLEAFRLFQRMRSMSLRPTNLTYVSLLGVSASLSVVVLSIQIHNLMIKAGVSLDLYAGCALVDVYSKCSCVDDARAVFDDMEDKDLVLWNSMIFGYSQNRRGKEALQLFQQLSYAGMRPNDFTYVALVTVASGLASSFHGLQFHGQIIKAGLENGPHIVNALLDMYAKCGFIEEAWTLFKLICGRDVVCWNSMISRYAQHGQTEEALEVFQMMRSKDIEPNFVTFVGILSACNHGGLVEEGLNHFHSMKHDFGIEPGIEHYASIVNLLGHAGKLQDAKKFIENMPIEPGAAVWRSLLSSCRTFGDVELGKHAAKMVMQMDPKNSGSYVLLSSIYASKEMWVDVEDVRTGMDYTGAEKEVGYSWIE